MLLYLDTLKKDVLPKKEREMSLHFNLILYDCDFVFVLLLYFWDGDGRDGCWNEGLVFDSHKHTYLLSLSVFTSIHPLGLLMFLHGSSCNHRLQAIWRGEGDEANSGKGFTSRSVFFFI